MIAETKLKNLIADMESVKMAIDAQVRRLPPKDKQRFYSIQRFIYQSLKDQK